MGRNAIVASAPWTHAGDAADKRDDDSTCVECTAFADGDDVDDRHGAVGGGTAGAVDVGSDRGVGNGGNSCGADGALYDEAATEDSDQRVLRHVRSAGGDIDGRVEQLLASAQHGGTVVYSGQSPPGSGVQDDGVPPSAEAAAQRSEWVDEVDDAVRFEDFEAVLSGTYALQPVSLTQGGLTAYEEAMAGLQRLGGAAATPMRPGETATPVRPSGRKRRRSPGSSSQRERQEAKPVVDAGRGDDAAQD